MLVKLNLSGHRNAELEAMGYHFPGTLQVDLADPELFNKVVAFLSPLMESDDTVELATPGLSTLAIIVVTAIHGLTGHFPKIRPLIRGAEGFVPGDLLDLQEARNEIGRTSRKDVVRL